MAITVQEAQVIFSADGLTQVKSQAGIAGRALDKTTSSAGFLIGKLRSVGSALTGVGGMLAGLGAGAAAGWMAKLAAGAEQTAIAFEVLLGSASASKQMVDALRALDMKTVFGFRELGDSAKMLLNYGVAGQSVVPMLSVISDIASGDSMKLEALTRAFGQMSATGRLMGQDLNQMINGGFNPLKEISDRTGVSMAVLKKEMEAGRISTAMVAQAFESATQSGGRFYQMNERMSHTTAGQFAKLKSNIELLAIEVGTVLLPEANKLIEWASKFVTAAEGVGTTFKTMVAKAKEWFQTIGDNLSDIGTVMGTVAGHILSVWGGLWTDLKNHASAFFTWMTSNAAIAAENVAIGIHNAKMRLNGTLTEEVTVADTNRRLISDGFGGTMAHPDDAFKTKTEMVSTLRQYKAATSFVAPKLTSNAGNGPLSEQIREQLELARKLRQEGRNAEAKAMEDDAAKKGKDERSNDRKRFNETPTGAGEKTSEQKSQTMSAEALFGSLRQGALERQLGLMTQGIDLQQQQLAAQNMIAKNVSNLNLGLA